MHDSNTPRTELLPMTGFSNRRFLQNRLNWILWFKWIK